MTIADNIKKFRKLRGLTQKKLGELCVPPISESTIRKYELGLLNPKLETLQRIAIALNIEPYQLDERITTVQQKTAFIKQLEQEIEEIKWLDPQENYFTNRYKSWIEDAQKELAKIQKEFTYEEFKDILTPPIKQLLELYEKLNFRGQKKAVEHIEMLTKIPEYLKETD